MRYELLIIPLAFLAACGTPQENCISSATLNVRLLTSEIEGQKQLIAQGSYWKDAEEEYTLGVSCDDPRAIKYTESSLCYRREVSVFPVQVRINEADERAKLAALQAKLLRAQTSAKEEVSRCQAYYPEG